LSVKEIQASSFDLWVMLSLWGEGQGEGVKFFRAAKRRTSRFIRLPPGQIHDIFTAMATPVGHSLVALTICAPLQRTSLGRAMSIYWWMLILVLVSLLPDLDVLLRWLSFSHLLSHRGLTHSLFFALIFTMVITVFCYLSGIIHGNIRTLIKVWLVFATVMASHGLMDALTDGGRGVALFSPFSLHRYFFPIRPIPVAWINHAVLFSPYMLHVYAVEVALFGPFCLAAWGAGADLSGAPLISTFRWLAAGMFFMFGIGIWIVRSQSL
jgi:inner membrane protein